MRREGGLPIAAGEDAAGLHDFRAAFEAGALDVAQPGVIKIGGPSAMVEIVAPAKAFGSRVVPHKRLFRCRISGVTALQRGPRFDAPFERLFIDLESSPCRDLVVAKAGRVKVPDGPGLGCATDMSVMQRYQVVEPVVHRV